MTEKLLKDRHQKNHIIEEIRAEVSSIHLTVLHSIAFYGSFDMFKPTDRRKQTESDGRTPKGRTDVNVEIFM